MTEIPSDGEDYGEPNDFDMPVWLLVVSAMRGRAQLEQPLLAEGAQNLINQDLLLLLNEPLKSWVPSSAPDAYEILDLALDSIEEAQRTFGSQPTGSTGTMLGLDLPFSPGRGRFWLNLQKMKDLRASVLMGLIANTLTHNPPVALTTSVLATIWNSVQCLSETDLEVVRAFRRLAGEYNPYKHWLEQVHVLRSLPDDRDQLLTLADMAARGILENHGDLWRLNR